MADSSLNQKQFTKLSQLFTSEIGEQN